MAVTNDFAASTLDLNGKVAINQPTALVWGADGRLYVTEADGDVRVLTVAFGDKDPLDSNNTAQFYVTEAVTLSLVKGAIQNHNDNGTTNSGVNRQVTGIDVTQQFDGNGNPIMIGGKPAVTIYVTSSDSRIGAGNGGGDVNLDTNSGVITKMVQTGPNSWDAIDIVRGLPRSEENHATNGLEVIQVLDATGKLVSERMIVAAGGNANTGAPSNNFAGQQEQPLSAAILEIDLTMISGMTVQTAANGRKFVYDIPTLNDPLRGGSPDNNDPFGGNDGFNSAKLPADGPISVYSPGYRNAYDVEVTEDGRVWTYDNGANNSWGGRPIGEAGDIGNTIDLAQTLGYIATNLNNGEGNTNDPINLVNWNPSNKDNFHEVTRSDDLGDRVLSAGQGGAQTFVHEGLTYVYGGHPNPTRAEGALAGLLFSPASGANDAYLLVSDQDSYADDLDQPDYGAVIDWFETVEAANPKSGIYGVNPGDLTKKVLSVTPGVLYDIYKFADGSGAAVVAGASPNLNPPANGTFLGQSGLPADIAQIVAYRNPIEGDYKEAGKTDGALDTGNGSINGLTEYTSTILDQGNVKMSGAIIAAQLNGGNLIIMGRSADGTMSSTTSGGFAVAADRTTLQTGAAPLGLAAIGDDFLDRGLNKAFQGSIWAASYGTSQPFIQIFQPQGTDVPLAGVAIVNPTDRDLDGVSHVEDPFEFSNVNGYALAPGEQILIDFNPQNTSFPNTISSTGLLGAALDSVTPNRDAQTSFEGFTGDQVLSGLYDIGGNILPGGNAPILQIKKVVAGTVVGSANSARDALHTGIRPSEDTDRIVATIVAKNWTLEKSGTAAAGQLTGMMFGDGTQSNFVRFVFGSVNGQLGFEVGFEIADVYIVLARVVVPGLADAGVNRVELRLTLDKMNGFAVTPEYRLEGQSEFTAVNLSGFVLPEGVLRDVLTGDHSIGAGDAPSGAAIGFLAENAAGEELDAVDFYSLRIDAFGNEIDAATGAQVGGPGSSNIDTVIYTGTDTVLAPLAPDVENFQGTGSAADYAVVANALDNVIRTGTGANVITTGAGTDVVRGTLEQLAGDEITDFTSDDKILVEGALLQDFDVAYASGSAMLTINGSAAITFSGPDFEDFAAADGPSVFSFTQTEEGVEITTVPALTPFIAISSGSGDLLGATLREQTVDFLSDVGSGGAAQFVTGVPSKTYTNAPIATLDIPDTALDVLHKTERSAVDAGKWGYSIPAPNGDYLIDLIFAEIFHGVATANATPGSRVFDIFVENALVEANFDVIAAAGGSAKEVIRTYQATVTDGVLNIEFDASVDQAKISGLAVWKLGGTFPPSMDTTAPVIEAITVENPQSVQDGPRTATVVLTDETGFSAGDFVGLTGSELVFTGIVPETVSAPVVALSNGGKTATLTYTLQAAGNSWPNGVGQIAIAAGAYGDAAGNDSAAVQTAFILQNNLGSLVRGNVVRAINVGTTDPAPGTLGTDLVQGGTDNNRYGGAIAADSLITDAAGNPIAFEADSNAYYTSPKSNTALNANVDGQSGTTGSNSGGVDFDGSAYHTYRDSSAASWTATYGGFAPGTYIVELHFAELFHASAGQRQGDFTLNGQVLALNFDLFTAAGGADKPTFLRQAVTVTDGNIVVGVSTDTGQPGFSAIVVYASTDPDLPPTISVADAQTVEGGAAIITFTRTGDLSEAVTVTFTVTPGSADASDYAAPVSITVVIPANQGAASITIPIVDDADEEPAETFTVSILSVSNASNDASVARGSAAVTIAASDPALQVPTGGTILDLDFETAGDPLVEGGFDGVLGGAGAVDTAVSVAVSNGKLIVNTSDGDLSSANASTDSKNDFVKAVDLSDPALTEIYLTTRFDNPFTPAVLAANGITNGVVPNYAQQGVLVATGDAATQRDAEQFQKLIFGGNGGSSVQLWSQGAGGTAAIIQVTAMSAAAVSSGGSAFGLDDIASVELSMRFDRVADVTGVFVTLFDASGAVLGGVRPAATPGFVTQAPLPTPPAVVAALDAGTSVVGVHSTDYLSFGSFPATWDFLKVTSPQVMEPPANETDSIRGTVIGDFADTGAAPTDIGTLLLGDNVIVATQQGDDAPGGRDRDYFTFTLAEGQVLSRLVLQGFETDEQGLPQGFIGIQSGPAVTVNPATFESAGQLLGGLVYNNGLVGNDILPELGDGEEQGFTFVSFDAPLPAGTYTVWLNQGGTLSTATLNFIASEAKVPSILLSIADAPSIPEGGDVGTATLQFGLTASDDFSGTVIVTYTALGEAGLTQEVIFANGVGVLSVAVPRDSINDGNDMVDVTLTGAVDGGTNGFDFGMDTATGTATGTVTEDDISAATLPKGALVFAVNAGGGTVTDTKGLIYQADVAGNWVGASNTYSDPGAQQPVNGDYTGDGLGNADDTIYATERWGGGGTSVPLTFQRGGLAPGEYVLTLKFADIFNGNATGGPAGNGIGARVFDVSVNGVQVIDDVDLLATVGLDRAYDVDVPVTVGADGLLTIAAAASVDNAKISALALFAAPPPDGTISIAAAPVLDETGDAGFTTLLFPLSLTGPDGTVTLSYSVDGVAQLPVEVTFVGGRASLSVLVANDDTDNGPESVSVLLTGVSEGFSLASAAASGTVTEDDGVDPDDLDGDGIVNASDLFPRDAQNGVTLTAGQEILLDFETPGTPVEAGFTGIIGTPSLPNSAGSVETGTATVAGGNLNIVVNKGDHFNNTNTQADAYAIGVKNAGSFALETAFVMPDFNAAATGVQAPVSFQTVGLVVSLSEDNLVKWVFGANGSNAFQLAAETRIGTATTSAATGPVLALPTGVTYAAIQNVRLTLEISVNPTNNVVTAFGTAFLTLTGGASATQSGSVILAANAPLALAILDENQGVSAGLIQTSTGTSAPTSFNVGYEYFKLSSTVPAPANQAPTAVVVTPVLNAIGEDADTTFATKVADISVIDDALGTNVLSLSGANADLFEIIGEKLFLKAGAALDFDANASLDVTVQVDDPTIGEIPDASAPFSLTVTNVNAAPTGEPIGVGPVAENAAPVVIDLLAGANAADSDGGTLGVTNVAVAVDGEPAGFTLVGSTLTIDPAQFAAALSAGQSAVVSVAYTITDGQGGETPNTAMLAVDGLNGPFAWYIDADGDAYGVDDPATNITAYTKPEGHAVQAGDANDTDAAIYPGAPEINDGKDNDQDNLIDEDNQAPVPQNDTATLAFNGVLAIPAAQLLENDSDPDFDTLEVVSVQDATNGTVALIDGVVTFMPTAGYSGPASFSYTVSDGVSANPQTATATVSLTVDANPVDPTPVTVRLQAESATLSGGYSVGTAATADDGRLILLPGGQTSGAATFDLAASGVQPGVYTLAIGYFDENDGESRLGIAVSGETPFNTVFTFDDDATSGNAAQAASFRVRVFENVTVGADSVLTLTGLRNAGEWARIDYVEFTGVVSDPDENLAPFAPFGIDDQTVSQNEVFDLDVTSLFADPEEDTLTFTVDGPDWLSIDANGRLTGLPGAGDVTPEAGVTVTVFASDGFNAPVPVSFQLAVEKVNTPPVTTGIANQTLRVGEGALVSVASAFADADNDTLTYALTGALPEGLSFDATTGSFTGQPTASGSFQVTVTASDGEATVASTFVFNVLPPTDARPTLRIEAETFEVSPGGFFVETLSGGRQAIRLQTNKSGEATLDFAGSQARGAYDLRIAFYDENDGISSASLFVDADGTGVFVPFGTFLFDRDGGGNAAGLQNLRILTFPGLVVDENTVLKLTASANAGEFARFDYVELVPVAGDVNFAPFIDKGLDDVTLQVPAAIAIDLEANDAFSDPEEDALNYVIVAGPDWLAIEGGVLSGTPPGAGVYAVTVGATDGSVNSGVTVQTSFTITVEGNAVTNQPPSVALTPVLNDIAENTVLAERLKVADIAISDDALGINSLSVTGSDASLFEVDASGLYLKAGAVIDFEANPSLDVAVQVDDATLGNAPDDTADFSLAVTDVDEPVAEQIVLRINAFGPQVTATDGGPNWLADNGTSGLGYLATTDNRGDAPAAGYTGASGAIPAGVPEQVLDTARSSNSPFSYNIPVADIGGAGFYRVNLYIAELFSGGQASAFRIFDASLEGAVPVAFNNITPGTAFGANVGVLSAEVQVTDGVLNIGFLQDTVEGVQNPIVNAIEVVRLAGPPADTMPPSVAMTLTNPTTASDPLLVSLALSDASGINMATLGAEDLQLTVSGIPTVATITFNGIAKGIATYAIAAPAGGWTDGLPVSVDLKAGEIADLAASPNGNLSVTKSLTLVVGGSGDADTSPNGDLDRDLILNTLDPDVDGDGTLNTADPFAYDAGNGVLLSAGEVIALDFNTPGTPYEAGFTGLLQAAVPGGTKAFAEETGTATVSGGALNVVASVGDTGTGNTPEDDYQLGVKNRAFTVEARVLNPFDGPAANFQQLGVHVGINSTDFVKFVFGFTSGVVEFSSRNNDVETKVGGGNIALPAVLGGLAGFEALDVTLVVSATSATAATVQAFATFLNGAGQPIAGATNVVFGTAAITGALAAAIFDESVGVGAGFTQTSIGSGGTFLAQLDNFKVTGGGTVVPPDPGSATEAFAAQTDLVTTASYGQNVNGGAILKIMEGNNSVAASNFGANSFQVENIGSKKISALFIDVTGALYPDSVFDPDGLGGDNAAKAWAVNSAGSTGGYVGGGVGGYFLPGQAPVPNAGGSGGPSNGGYKGAMVKFNPDVDGGFQFGEIVGFSGDMDPNSIAGMSKANVDSGATQSWDVGGISGHELIGSLFTVLFDDGSTASGQLISDKSNAGAIAVAAQGLAPKEVSLVVNGTTEGGVGTYGGTPPTVIVEGDPGQLVRITMTRGFDPVTNPLNGIDGLVTQRLSRYDFKANNAYDDQSVDVTIGASGTFDATALFKYGAASGTAKGTFGGDKTASIGFVASAIGTIGDDVVALGPVTAPIYLNNAGGPVAGGATAPEGYYQMIGSGNSARFKVQAEDPNGGNGGISPGGNWSFFSAADSIGTATPTTGDQAGFQGAGYYLFGANQSTTTGIVGVADDNVLEYTINITETGTYTFRARASRDGLAPGDQQNDIWLNFKKKGSDEHIEDYLAPSSSEAEPISQDYIKVFGGPNNGTWGFASGYDGVPQDPLTQLVITETGLYTIQIAGRSFGFHMDYWELYKGSAPTFGATNSIFVPTGPTVPTVTKPIDDQQIEQGDGYSFSIPASTFGDLDGDVLTLAVSAPAGFSVNGTSITAGPNLAVGNYTIAVTATDDDTNSVSDTFIVSVIEDAGVTEFQARVLSAQDDIELGTSVTSSDLETNKVVQLRFTVGDGVAGVTNVTSALLSWQSERNQSGSSTLTFQVEDSLAAQAFGTGKTFVGGSVVVPITGAWRDNATITNVVDLADQINALIASKGPLDAGETINVQLTGTGATRYIQQATALLDITAGAQGSGGGGSTSGSTSATIAAGNGDVEISTLPTGALAVNLTSANLEFGTDNFGSTNPAEPQKVNVVGMRFTGLELPDNAVITDAHFIFQAFASSNAPSDFDIAIQNSTSGAVFNTTATAFTSRSYVGNVDWTPEEWISGGTYRSPDVSGLIEQVIGAGGLDATDALVFRVAGTGVREAHSFEAAGAAPILLIEYDLI